MRVYLSSSKIVTFFLLGREGKFTNNSEVKKQRLNYDRADRMSSLPDGVLIQVLSFLPTADVVRTCILSKRWELIPLDWAAREQVFGLI